MFEFFGALGFICAPFAFFYALPHLLTYVFGSVQEAAPAAAAAPTAVAERTAGVVDGIADEKAQRLQKREPFVTEVAERKADGVTAPVVATSGEVIEEETGPFGLEHELPDYAEFRDGHLRTE